MSRLALVTPYGEVVSLETNKTPAEVETKELTITELAQAAAHKQSTVTHKKELL